MILRKIAFSLFFIAAIIFYFLIYKTFKYTNSQGYKVIHPFPEVFKFLDSCSKIQKEINDNNLKFLLLSINIVVCFCVIIFLSIAFLM